MSTQLIVVTIILHFLFDWILQPRDIAKKKGLSREGFYAVYTHITINIAPFTAAMYFFAYHLGNYNPFYLGIILVLNLLLHFFIDIFLPKGKTERSMINWTAIDQILHLTILFTLLNLK